MILSSLNRTLSRLVHTKDRGKFELLNPMRDLLLLLAAAALAVAALPATRAESQTRSEDPTEFGPVVRAYLGYLDSEQEVVDDRASRHEVSRAYYIRNSNRIRALRQKAIEIARESRNDYLPELEAVTRDEMRLILERPPRPETLHEGDVVRGTFRFLGAVRYGEWFFVFARLDPYEQAELAEQAAEKSAGDSDQKTTPAKLSGARSSTSP